MNSGSSIPANVFLSWTIATTVFSLIGFVSISILPFVFWVFQQSKFLFQSSKVFSVCIESFFAVTQALIQQRVSLIQRVDLHQQLRNPLGAGALGYLRFEFFNSRDYGFFQNLDESLCQQTLFFDADCHVSTPRPCM